MGFEYKVVPAPVRGLKGKGIKGTPARFANALQSVMNDMGAEGWEYQRTDTLPVEERVGLTGKTTSFQNMLVFRRAITVAKDEALPVAALIEDKSDAAIEPEQVEDALPEVEVEVEDTPEDIAATAEDFVGDMPQEPEQKTPVTLAAEDRVSETLKAPFTFPWNRRRQTVTPDKDGDSHVAAE